MLLNPLLKVKSMSDADLINSLIPRNKNFVSKDEFEQVYKNMKPLEVKGELINKVEIIEEEKKEDDVPTSSCKDVDDEKYNFNHIKEGLQEIKNNILYDA